MKICIIKVILGFFQGKPFSTVKEDDSVWTIEDGDGGKRILSIVLTKADYVGKEKIWEALMDDRSYQPDPMTFHEMRKKIDLEKFQLEVNFILLFNFIFTEECTSFFKFSFFSACIPKIIKKG